MGDTGVNLSTELLVREYLQTKGYSKTLEALESECTLLQSVALQDPKSALVPAYLSQDLYIKTMSKDDGSEYSKEFKGFSLWIASSLDLVKPYLQAIGFVFFTHCYIGLIRHNLEDKAREFFAEYHDSLCYTFTEELQHLALLHVNCQLSQSGFKSINPFVKTVISSKFSVSMTKFAFSLLASYLDEHELVLLAAIINENVQIDIIADKLNYQELVDVSSLVQLPGYSLSRSKGWSTSKLTLGVPGSGKHLTAAQQISSLFNNIQQIDRQDSLYKAWLDRLVRPKVLLKKVAKRNRTGLTLGSSVEQMDRQLKFHLKTGSQVLSYVDNQDQDSAGDITEPTILFSTIGNAHDNLVCMDIHPNLAQIATGYQDSIVRVWRLDRAVNPENPCFGQSLASSGYRSQLTEVYPKPKVAFTEEQIDMQKAAQLDLCAQTIQSQESCRYPMLELKGHSQPVFSVSQDSTERLVLSSAADGSIRLWDTAVLQCVSKYQCLSTAWDVSFSPVDHYFAAANQDRTVTMYSTDRNNPIRMCAGHTSDVNKVTWHGNATLFASGGDDKTVRLWDIRKAECVRILQGCASAISSLSISTLGNLLAAGTESGKIYLYELTTSRLLAIMHGHEESVHALSFSADGLHVISGSNDCSVRIWDTLPAFEGSEKSEQKASQVILRPKHAFFTKASPVYAVGCTGSNLIYAGGPCHALSQEGSMGAWTAQGRGAGATSSEQEAAQLLGLSSAVPSLT